jgi:GTPase SAR1 family protein
MDKNLKITIVGDVGSGKTWLWQSYFQNRKPTTYIQTIFDNYSTTLSYNGQEVRIHDCGCKYIN